MRSIILATMLLASPALAQGWDRGDLRSLTSPKIYCPTPYQALHNVTALPNSGASEFIGESANGGDCEWDGVGQDWAADHDGILFVPPDGDGDYWSHAAYQLNYGVRDYSVTAQAVLFGTGWTHTFDPPAALAGASSWVQVVGAFLATPGYTYTMWESHSGVNGVSRQTVYCNDGRAPVEWRSWEGGPLPVVTVNAPVECRWFQDSYCNVSVGTPTVECTASSGWRYALIQSGGGCGVGPELLFAMPFLVRRRKTRIG